MATIINGLFSGRSGLQSHGAAISVLADNIANANTVGYKASRADFVDLLAGNLSGGGAASVGSGSSVQKVTQLFDQGTFEFTNRGLDLGIDGNGFFIVEDQAGTRFYTRAGNFEVDSEGNLLNQNSYKVLGFPTGGAGGLEELNVNQLTQDSVATTAVSISGNLDASATALPGGVADIPAVPNSSFAELNEAAAFSTSVDVFDSLGAAHPVTVYFFKTGSGAWTARGYVDGSHIQGGTAGDPQYLGTVDMTFDQNGVRTDSNTFLLDPEFNGLLGWQTNAAPDDITVTLTPFTQFSANSSISSISQDGTGGGSVVSFNVEPDGTLFALLDNGQTSSVGTIALATFANPEGLKRQGESLYVNSTTSGEPVFGRPQTGQFGGIQAGALELSTADIAGDFIKLISLQRGFQGSSRVITSINDLLQEIMNLAR